MSLVQAPHEITTRLLKLMASNTIFRIIDLIIYYLTIINRANSSSKANFSKNVHNSLT